ncbi:MAG: SCO family protein [Chloroflexi bacterium]|nr:SCO family protein [Chloroflexota bacterium]
MGLDRRDLRTTFGLGLLALFALAACAPGPRFEGTALEPPISSPAFLLQDQFGRARATADFRGKVVVLSFMYTRCPDICPLLAEKLKQARADLGRKAEAVAFVVVSVDPEGDTEQAALDFSQRHGLAEDWSYLVGSRKELERVWNHYYVESHKEGDEHSLIDHSAPVYLLDRRGEARVLHRGSDLEAPSLVQDIRVLLR